MKDCFTPLYFYERYWYLFLLTEIRKRFLFLQKKKKKGQKAKIVFSVCFPASCCIGSEHSCRERGPTKLLPWEPHSASKHQIVRALNCVCEHLCFISICFVHPLARCVLRYNSFFALHHFGLQKVSKSCILTTGLPGKFPVPFLKISFFYQLNYHGNFVGNQLTI